MEEAKSNSNLVRVSKIQTRTTVIRRTTVIHEVEPLKKCSDESISECVSQEFQNEFENRTSGTSSILDFDNEGPVSIARRPPKPATQLFHRIFSSTLTDRSSRSRSTRSTSTTSSSTFSSTPVSSKSHRSVDSSGNDALVNMGSLVTFSLERRMQERTVFELLRSTCQTYPFEVCLNVPIQADGRFVFTFNWDFKHHIYFELMYSMVNRFFYNYNRLNSQLFYITNEKSPEQEPLQCVNIPSKMKLYPSQLSQPGALLAAISTFGDKLAFLRLNAEADNFDIYQHHIYVPPTSTRRCK